MEMDNTSVADLVVQMHSNIDSIHECVQSLSNTTAHDAEMEKLEAEREAQISSLHQAHQTEAEKLAEQRQNEEEELATKRRIEEEELMERRRIEDEERKARFEAEKQERAEKKKLEDEAKAGDLEEKRRGVSEGVEAELERLEDEMERKVEEGKRMLAELDEKRRAINAQIEAALNTPNVIPKINFRSRARTRGISVIGDKTPFATKAAQQASEPEQIDITKTAQTTSNEETSKLQNSDTQNPSESGAEGIKETPADDPKSATSETREVSEAAPEKHAHNNEVSSAESETNDVGERILDTEEAHPATEENRPHEKQEDEKPEEETSSFPANHPAVLESPNASTSPALEHEQNDEAPAIESEPAQDTAHVDSLEIEIEDEQGRIKTGHEAKEIEPKIAELSEGPGIRELASNSSVIKHAESDPEISKQRPSPANVLGESEEPVAENALALEETASHVPTPTITVESEAEEPILKTHEDESSTLKEPASPKEPKVEESVVVAPPTPIESQIKSELPIIVEDSKVEDANPAPLESKAQESALVSVQTVDCTAENVDEHLSGPVSGTEPEEDTGDYNVAEEEVDLESEPSPTEQELENAILADQELDPEYSYVSHAKSLSLAQQDVKNVNAFNSPKEKLGEKKPIHKERAAEVNGYHQTADDHLATDLASQAVNSSEIKDMNSTPKAEEVKPRVMEDPEDSKAREEIARLNAEFMKAPVEEEHVNQRVANETMAEMNTEDRGANIIQESLAPQEKLSHHDNLDTVSEHLLEPDQAAIDEEGTRTLTTNSQEPESPHEKTSEDAAIDDSVKASSERSDSTVDARTPIRTPAEAAEYDHEVDDTNIKPATYIHEQANSTSSGTSETSPLPVTLATPENPQVPNDFESRENPPQSVHEEIYEEGKEAKDLDAEKESMLPSSLEKDPEVYDSISSEPQAAKALGEANLDAFTPTEAEPGTVGPSLEDTRHTENNPPGEYFDTLHNQIERDEDPAAAGIEPEFHSHPRTRALSAAEDESGEFPRAESPVTVLNSDDLFEDDDEDELEDTPSHNLTPTHDDIVNEKETEFRGLVKTPVQTDETANYRAQQSPQLHNESGNELEVPLNKQHRISQEIHRTNSGKFASLVDAVRSDEPIVSHLVKQEKVQEIGMPGGGHFSDEVLEDDLETTENLQNDEEEYVASHAGEISVDQVAHQYPNYEGESYPSSPMLHARTHTADTVPSFDTDAQSDDSTPSTPDTAISPPRQVPRDEPTIRQSWMHQGEELQHAESDEELKSVVTPLHQTEFDSFSSHAYPSYITPKSSLANLQSHVVEESAENRSTSPEFYNGRRGAYNEERNNSPSPVPPHYPPTDMSHMSPSSESRPYDSQTSYDSPESTSRSLHPSSPSREIFSTTDQTPPPPPSRSPRRLAFPPPSSLAKPPVSSPSTAGSYFFQKTRSLFESSSRPDAQPAPPITRPKSIVFGVGRSTNSPSPPPKPSSLKSRPSSLSMHFGGAPRYDEAPTSPADELLVPKSLNGNGKPPSPAFTLPLGKMVDHRGRGEEHEDEYAPRDRRTNSFLDGISKLGGLVGLEGSMHNPKVEAQPLLGNERSMHGY